jgi:fructose-specific phosphotransferase system component IIB
VDTTAKSITASITTKQISLAKLIIKSQQRDIAMQELQIIWFKWQNYILNQQKIIKTVCASITSIIIILE